MSDREDIREESRSRSRTPKSEHSRSHSRSPSRKYSRSRSRSRSRRRSYSRSRSRSYGRRHHYSRSRSHSRSRSPYYKRRRSSYHGDRDRRYSGGYYRSRSRSPMSNRRRHMGKRDDPEESRCIGVFGLSLYTQDKDLREVFSRYGSLDEVNVVYDHQTGRSRGFAFVYFRNKEDAREAKDRCNGLEVDGRRIRVDYSITKRAHTPTPGIYLGKPTSSGYGRYRGRSNSPYQQRVRRYSRSRSRSRSYSPRRY